MELSMQRDETERQTQGGRQPSEMEVHTKEDHLEWESSIWTTVQLSPNKCFCLCFSKDEADLLIFNETLSNTCILQNKLFKIKSC